ncbi:unnamed protein product [Pichia kudriavzevii]
MRVPFRVNKRLATLQLKYQPRPIRTLLKVVKYDKSDINSGPRTLDSVLSFLPTLKVRNNYNTNSSESPDLSNHSSNENCNVFICVSQRDFPLGIHQRILPTLVWKGIDLNNVHWVLTDADQICSYHGVAKVSQENVEIVKMRYLNDLNTYLGFFRDVKIKDESVDVTSLFETYPNSEEMFRPLKKYKVHISNLHLYSAKLPWTVPSIMESIDFDYSENSSMYVIGQTNTGKTSLVKDILRTTSESINSANPDCISDHNKVKPEPYPFSSSFNHYTTPGLQIVDTPGYVRKNGGIWGHVNKWGAVLLQIKKDWKAPKVKQLRLCPRFSQYTGKPNVNNTGFSIGKLVYLKPWTKDSQVQSISVKVGRNMPGSIKPMCFSEIQEKLASKEGIIKEKQWVRYLVEGNDYEIILDNIGSFKVKTHCASKVYWEMILPERVRVLSRSYDKEKGVSFSTLVRIESKIPIALNNIE